MSRQRIRSSSTRAQQPFWLCGEDTCGHCHQRYVHEHEFRCVVCDGPVCMHCVIVVRSEARCPACGAVEDDRR